MKSFITSRPAFEFAKTKTEISGIKVNVLKTGLFTIIQAYMYDKICKQILICNLI